MRYSVEFRPSAVTDLADALAWYDARNPVAGEKLRAEINSAIKRIAESPDSFSGFAKGTRRYLFKRFPYSMVYRVREQVIEIIAVAHHARGPSYWKRRLRGLS